MKDYYTEFLPDLEEFADKTMKFHNGEIKVPEYKGFSGGYGSYAQRGAKTHMLRLRMAGGRVTKERLKAIVSLCEEYAVKRIKLTTCESIQLHDLEAEVLTEMMEKAWKADMISRGGGGDFPRNVMMSPLSGVEKGENFDVAPYALAAGEYLMGFIKGPKFPRKLKVCFSNSKENVPHATFRDLGFVSRPDGTFDVYIAGGLGNNPKLGICVEEAVKPDEILYYVKAMVDTFLAHGNYENRGRARTRYMQETLGTEGLKEAFHQKLAEAKEQGKLTFSVEEYAALLPDAEAKSKRVQENALEDISVQAAKFDAASNRIMAQKQDGLYAVFYQPLGGYLSPEKLAGLSEAISDMEAVELRITPEEGLYIINCDATEAKKLAALTDDSAKTLFEQSVACVGNTTCQVGIGDSQGLLKLCVETVAKENFADRVLPKIHISGCPSSCAAQQTAEIGFRGAMKQTPDGPKPAFAIFVGGCSLQGKEELAEAQKAIAVEDIPKFLVDLGKMITEEHTIYTEWIKENRKKLDELIARYTA